ncbi:hypothetical protein B8W69_10660 [Mycobacterium vulneris]|uniref:Uncharacterized protein n=1 Tax=Mycolicibacterium vulneris TaxID=547163 RepID=A0A1X2L4B1_9MYCO|nr:hypothetical protein [Mycolicibacterium vulneris]OSC28824.1 hypothetical protein B8W69_10660 [Mycolicibacterium vulneris]
MTIQHQPLVRAWDLPLDEQQQVREFARKYNTEIDSVYLKIQSKCPVTGPTKYLNKKDVQTLINDHYELSKSALRRLNAMTIAQALYR